MDDIQIDGVGQFVRANHVNLRSQSKDDNLNLFGQMYANNPERFEFMPGDRILIKEISKHVREIVDCGGINKGMEHFNKKNPINSTNGEAQSNDIEIVEQNTGSHYLLGKLIEHANRNALRKKGGYRYDKIIKRFSAYFRMIAGPLTYETIQKNLEHSLPSLVSVNRYIRSANCHIVEGVLRTQELLLYLKERNLPLSVIISEDLTRIIGRPQYCAITNQIVGFVLPTNHANGMPIPYSYPARDAYEIYDHFSKKNSIASNLSVTMAQPLGDAHAFCLLAYGTDNKYTGVDVTERWKFITNELQKVGITVLIISSDSDPKYNGAMRKLSNLGCVINEKSKWFACDIKSLSPFYVQDPAHLGAKIRNFLLRTIFKKIIPFGKYFITWKHLHVLIQIFEKDKHQLTLSVLNPDDKQKFDYVLRMCDPKVTKLLADHVEGSQATVLYLDMLRNILEAFLHQSLTPLERVRKIWYPLFIIRIWRQFIVSNKRYTLKDNFLSTNCYSCVELNAHSLVLCMLHLGRMNRADLFKPWLYESQACESIFRQFRCFTSTYSTKTNCTVKEAESRISNIQLQNDIMHGTRSHLIYPRLQKKQNEKPNFSNVIPTETEIFNVIEKCKEDAIAMAKSLGLVTKNHSNDYLCKTPPYKLNKKRMDENGMNDSIDLLDPPDLQKIQLKNYAGQLKKEVSYTSPYCEIPTDDSKKIIFRKSSLCWLWREECKKLSNDRLQRVTDPVLFADKPKKTKKSKAKSKQLNTKKAVLYEYKPMRINKRKK